jgi:hypothetical protein
MKDIALKYIPIKMADGLNSITEVTRAYDVLHSDV